MPPKKTLEQDLLMLGGAKPAVLKLTEAASDKATTAADYAKHWSEEGYGVALMDDKNGKVVQAYFDANDYPSLASRVVNDGQGRAKIIGTKFSLELHSGQLETALAQQQDEEDQCQYQQALTEAVRRGASLDEDWKMRVRKSYSSLDELKRYDEIYNIASRLGYSSAEELWEKNPVIAGSVNPSDLRVVQEEEKQPWEMTRDEFIAQAQADGKKGSPDVPLARSQGDKHENIVTQAVKDGKAVPDEVLKDYPQFKAGAKVQEAEEPLPEFEVTGTIKMGYEWDVSAYVPTAEYSGPGSFRVESSGLSGNLKDEVLLGGLQDKVSGYGSGNTSFPFSLVIEAKDADEAKEKALASLSDKKQWDTNLYVEGEYQTEHPDMTITDITVEIDDVQMEESGAIATAKQQVTESSHPTERIEKIKALKSPEEKSKMIYQWVKSGVVGFKEFKELSRLAYSAEPEAKITEGELVEENKNIAGQKIVDVRPMTVKELAKEGWEDAPAHSIPMALVLANGSVLYPSQDEEGNGPGAFWIINVHTPYPLWGKESEVKGKTIERVRRATARIVSTLGFNKPTAELVLDGNISILAGADNEGNDSGATFMSQGDKVYTIG